MHTEVKTKKIETLRRTCPKLQSQTQIPIQAVADLKEKGCQGLVCKMLRRKRKGYTEPDCTGAQKNKRAQGAIHPAFALESGIILLPECKTLGFVMLQATKFKGIEQWTRPHLHIG